MKKHKQTKMHIQNAEKPSSWWFMGGTKPDAFVGGSKKLKD
jgi:hypothetical protein